MYIDIYVDIGVDTDKDIAVDTDRYCLACGISHISFVAPHITYDIPDVAAHISRMVYHVFLYQITLHHTKSSIYPCIYHVPYTVCPKARTMDLSSACYSIPS